MVGAGWAGHPSSRGPKEERAWVESAAAGRANQAEGTKCKYPKMRPYCLRNSKEAVARAECRRGQRSGVRTEQTRATGRAWGFSCGGGDLRVWGRRMTGSGICFETALAARSRMD